ncbi:2905_t:CDS:1 [Cetraspora pellucida]|uniref:2905_t:CDS:1 n=1 Tax=Cetraspora pellucida TaxID=1433469 RepID=A0A9N9P836_9GLOM|nr:2905_t:CDS:1 [Cetraspora pellucida]
MSVNKSSSSKPLESTSVKCKADKSKEGRPRMPICNDFSEGKDDKHKHFRANCYYYDRGKWQCEKPFTIEAHLVLHCKRLVPDDIRRKCLIKVVKKGEKVNDKDDETSARKKIKLTNQSITLHYPPINKLSS